MADVQQIIRDLLLRSGLNAAQIDVSQVKGRLHGVVLGERLPLRDAVSQIQQFFQLDAIEDNGTLRFIPRGKTAVATITEEQTIEGFLTERLAEISLPEQLDVVHLDPATDYQPSVQTALRQTSFSQHKESVRTAIAVQSSIAKVQADTLLEASWVERFRVKFSIPLRFMALQVGDVIDIAFRSGRMMRVRLLRVLFQENTLEIDAVSTSAQAYQQSVVPEDITSTSRVQLAQESTLYLLDIPLVDNASAGAAYFMAVTQQEDDQQWQYATVYSGVSEQSLVPLAVLPESAVAGRVLTVLPAPVSSVYWDALNTVDVVLDSGILQSSTPEEVLNGANTIVIGHEVLQFQTATLIAPKTYQLSMLLRGRRGTEWAMDTHDNQERFVVLGSGVVEQPISLEEIQQELSFAAVSSGALLEDAERQDFTPTAVNIKPYAPVHFVMERVGQDLKFSWVRRTRFGGGWLDNTDVPLAEEQEIYDIDILHNGALVRTAQVNERSFLYDAASQISDTGALVSSGLTAHVYQRSAVAGRGYAARV